MCLRVHFLNLQCLYVFWTAGLTTEISIRAPRGDRRILAVRTPGIPDCWTLYSRRCSRSPHEPFWSDTKITSARQVAAHSRPVSSKGKERERWNPETSLLHVLHNYRQRHQQDISTWKRYSPSKIDVKSAFRLIPVHPFDRHLLAMEWKDNIYVDTCLPFCLRSAPKLFNIMADLLAWILEHQGVSNLMHYLDDFITMGHPQTVECQRNLDTLIQVCKLLNIPIAIQKVEGPTPAYTS